MKKALCLVLVLAMILCTAAATAEGKAIDGQGKRDIKINPAGLNEVEPGVSPTTGRNLAEIEVPNGYLGLTVTGEYQPIMVQISNADNGLGSSSGVKVYRNAPVNGVYADVVYEALQKRGGGETRMSMIFSDVVPDYVGFVRSTRITHVLLRKEWECAFCTSGYNYAVKDIPDAWKLTGVPDPSGKRTQQDPGIAYVGDMSSKPWGPCVLRIFDRTGTRYASANSELFDLVTLLTDVVPKDHTPANHTFKFTDELPTGGDEGNIVYVKFGNEYNTDSRLEYDPANNVYIRYIKQKKGEDLPYRSNVLVSPEKKKVTKDGKNVNGMGMVIQGLEAGEPITFSNVIIQGIEMKWKGSGRPDPTLVGSGNADYFMGGRHIAGVWERKDLDSRTVFYGDDGNEIELQRGRTLIILMPYAEQKAGVSYE